MNTKTNTKNKKKLMLGTMAGAMALTGVAGTVAPLLSGETTVVEAATFGDFTYTDNGDGTATITDYAGGNQPELDLVIPSEIDGLTVIDIGKNAFSPSSSFDTNYYNSITIPEGITSIGSSAFKGVAVTSGTTTLPESLVSIGDYGFFKSDMNIQSLPTNLQTIGREGFKQANLTGELIIPSNLVSIGNQAFYNNSIDKVTFLGTSPITFGGQDFQNNKITSFEIPEWLTSIPGSFLKNNNLTSIEIPETVTRVNIEAFDNNLLTSVTLNEGLEFIGGMAFGNNSLTSIIIPSTVTEIKAPNLEGAFLNNNLSKVTIKGETTTIEAGSFDGNQTTASNLMMYAPNPSIAYNFGTTQGYTMMEYIPPEPEPEPEPTPEEGTNGSTEAGIPGNEQTNDVTANIINGDLLLDPVTVDSFGDIPLTTDASVNYASITSPLTVTDNRGTQEGWTLNVSATPFASADHTLPAGSLTLEGVESVTATSTTPGIAPSNTLSATTVIDDGSVVVAEALNGEGAGVFEIAFPQDALALTVDSSTAKIGNYNSTVTWTLASTPTGN